MNLALFTSIAVLGGISALLFGLVEFGLRLVRRGVRKSVLERSEASFKRPAESHVHLTSAQIKRVRAAAVGGDQNKLRRELISAAKLQSEIERELVS